LSPHIAPLFCVAANAATPTTLSLFQYSFKLCTRSDPRPSLLPTYRLILRATMACRGTIFFWLFLGVVAGPVLPGPNSSRRKYFFFFLVFFFSFVFRARCLPVFRCPAFFVFFFSVALPPLSLRLPLTIVFLSFPPLDYAPPLLTCVFSPVFLLLRLCHYSYAARFSFRSFTFFFFPNGIPAVGCLLSSNSVFPSPLSFFLLVGGC